MAEADYLSEVDAVGRRRELVSWLRSLTSFTQKEVELWSGGGGEWGFWMRGWDVVEIQLLFTWVLAARVKQKLNFWFGGGGRMGFLDAGMGRGRNSTSLHVGAGCTCKAEIELLVWWWGEDGVSGCWDGMW